MNSKKTTKVILTDIEGTTSSISFVHEVLFPYAKNHLKTFIENNYEQVKPILDDVLEQIKSKAKTQDEIIKSTSEALTSWINEDKKIKALKDLQGLIWEDGYKSKAFYGHIYEDAYKKLIDWHKEAYEIYIYSSGSVKAQELLFSHTQYGDLNKLFKGNFDTKIGGKKEIDSYLRISNEINTNIDEILFLSDSEEELEAASQAGMQVIKLARPEDQIKPSQKFISVERFEEIKINS